MSCLSSTRHRRGSWKRFVDNTVSAPLDPLLCVCERLDCVHIDTQTLILTCIHTPTYACTPTYYHTHINTHTHTHTHTSHTTHTHTHMQLRFQGSSRQDGTRSMQDSGIPPSPSHVEHIHGTHSTHTSTHTG